MLLGGYFVEKIILYRKDLKNNPLIRRIAVLLVVLAAVSFLNPLGIKGVIYSLTINTQDGPVVSREVQPLFTANDDSPKSNFFPLGGLVPLFVVSLVSFIVAYRKRHIFYFLGILASGLLTYKVIRSFPFFAIFFLLAMSANLNDIFLRAKNYLNTRKPFTWIGVEVVVTCLVIVGLTMGSVKYLTSVGCGDFGIGLARNAEDAAKFFVDNKIKGPILNDTDVGSYLIWYLYPQEKVFADNRFGDAYSDDFFANDYKPLFSDEKKWQEMKEKYQFNSIFLYQYNLNEVRDFIFRRINDPEWVFVYGDRYNVILVKNAPENQTVIDRFAIRHDNVMARFSHLINSLDSADLVAVGDLFGLMGQIPWARTAYASAVSQTPNWPKIWFVMGRLELTRGDTQNSDLGLALLFLHQAIDRGWKTVNAYSYLALAYYRLNQLDKAEAAVREELKLNPKSDDANVWLVKLAEARARQVVEK